MTHIKKNIKKTFKPPSFPMQIKALISNAIFKKNRIFKEHVTGMSMKINLVSERKQWIFFQQSYCDINHLVKLKGNLITKGFLKLR